MAVPLPAPTACRLAASVLLALLALVGPSATTANAAQRTPDGREILELPDHDEDHSYKPSERPAVPALPVDDVESVALGAWALAFVPAAGAATGGLAGLRRRRSEA